MAFSFTVGEDLSPPPYYYYYPSLLWLAASADVVFVDKTASGFLFILHPLSDCVVGGTELGFLA